jgi:hypothetical protein
MFEAAVSISEHDCVNGQIPSEIPGFRILRESMGDQKFLSFSIVVLGRV